MTWVPITRETQAATQAEIERILGLSRETFRASAFFAQGDGAAFCDAAPKERKRVLAEVLRLDVWERLHELNREKLRAQADELQAAEGESRHLRELVERNDGLEHEIDAVGRLEADAVTAHGEATADAHDLYERVDAARIAREKVQKIEGNLTFAKLELDQLEGISRAAEAAIRERTICEDEVVALATPGQIAEAEQAYRADLERFQRVSRMIEEADVISENALELNGKADDLRGAPELAPCPTCGQALEDPEARERVIVGYDTEADELMARSAQLNEEAKAIGLMPPDDSRLRAARADVEQRARLETLIAGHAAAIAATDEPGFRERLGEARRRAFTLEADLEIATAGTISQEAFSRLGTEAQQADQAVEAARVKLEGIRIQKAGLAERQRAVSEATEKLAAIAVRTAELQAEADVLNVLDRAYGRDGIPALIVESAAIPQIEVEASRILQELGSPFRVELRTQRELKSADGLAETLDVVVLGEGGLARAYETFSGGERTRINLALRISLARLLAHRRGAESRVLVVDEPEFLDEPGTQALAEVLRGLSDDFERIYLVSHVPTLRDAFDQVIEVEKVDGRSRVAGAAVTRDTAEAVA